MYLLYHNVIVVSEYQFINNFFFFQRNIHNIAIGSNQELMSSDDDDYENNNLSRLVSIYFSNYLYYILIKGM